jgi:hypothetical protein
MTEGGIISLVVSIIAALVSVGGFLLNRRKTTADLATLYESMNTRQADIIKNQREREDCMHAALSEREDYIITLLEGIGRLTHQLKLKTNVPVWEPSKPLFLYDRFGKKL